MVCYNVEEEEEEVCGIGGGWVGGGGGGEEWKEGRKEGKETSDSASMDDCFCM
jgi:hypothetical protein